MTCWLESNRGNRVLSLTQSSVRKASGPTWEWTHTHASSSHTFCFSKAFFVICSFTSLYIDQIVRSSVAAGCQTFEHGWQFSIGFFCLWFRCRSSISLLDTHLIWRQILRAAWLADVTHHDAVEASVRPRFWRRIRFANTAAQRWRVHARDSLSRQGTFGAQQTYTFFG